ncbi:unnamed protein product [Caenorhabditis auriculariae]|uniref:Fe2OG dioxygenase domain-containing protein n=1 Tax=Caenorhabditis auriculariae TaxID=2777116 RepID=A0A8S1GUK9_9PELO|nr:unnamed protein product [Caenorhabditis auriculariae]
MRKRNQRKELRRFKSTMLLDKRPIDNFQTGSPQHEAVLTNGTWIAHRRSKSFRQIYTQLQRNILALDLRSSEHWQVLSYNKEGHYAPHYDYMNPKTNNAIVNLAGNRIATVLVILQTAKLGGTTVFPKLGVNIRPKIGDVIVWINILPNSLADHDTLHAACPILDGVKIGATLWVHEYHQEQRLRCSIDSEYFNTERFFKPFLSAADYQLTRQYFD